MRDIYHPKPVAALALAWMYEILGSFRSATGRGNSALQVRRISMVSPWSRVSSSNVEQRGQHLVLLYGARNLYIFNTLPLLEVQTQTQEGV